MWRSCCFHHRTSFLATPSPVASINATVYVASDNVIACSRFHQRHWTSIPATSQSISYSNVVPNFVNIRKSLWICCFEHRLYITFSACISLTASDRQRSLESHVGYGSSDYAEWVNIPIDHCTDPRPPHVNTLVMLFAPNTPFSDDNLAAAYLFRRLPCVLDSAFVTSFTIDVHDDQLPVCPSCHNH